MSTAEPEVIEICQLTLGSHHRPTGKTTHYQGKEELPSPAALKIVQYPGYSGFYLLYLDRESKEMTDTYHESLDDALEQAHWEFGTEPGEWAFSKK